MLKEDGFDIIVYKIFWNQNASDEFIHNEKKLVDQKIEIKIINEISKYPKLTLEGPPLGVQGFCPAQPETEWFRTSKTGFRRFGQTAWDSSQGV